MRLPGGGHLMAPIVVLKAANPPWGRSRLTKIWRRIRMVDQTEKPKLGTRPPLGLKRTVETGKVKQSFSHGRSNTVVVEVKKRRILGRPGEAPPPEAPKPIAEAPKPAPAAPKPAAAAPQPRKPSAQDEISNRRELQ